MSFLKKYATKKKEEFMSHVSGEIKALVGSGQMITLSEFSGMRMNNYERRLLIPLFSGELLQQQIEYGLGQEDISELYRFSLPHEYGDDVLRCLIPELLRRLKWRSPRKISPPAGLKVLATYLNRFGNRRVMMAKRVPAKFEECNCEDRGCEFDRCCGEYDEDKDCYYVRAGWYEVVENSDEFDFVPIDGEVDGWKFVPVFSLEEEKL
jgi:hypothetical protein